jgi:hypothetical protein
VERDDRIAKFWLDPARFQNSGGFGRLELRKIRSIIQDNRDTLMECWHDYFGN